MGYQLVSKALRVFQEFVGGEDNCLHYNVPTAKSSFCQLIDYFEAKYINGVSFVDPFYSLHWAKLKTYCLKIFVCVCRYKGERIALNTEPLFFSNPVSWTTRNLMTLDPVSSLLLLLLPLLPLPKLHLLGLWSVDQLMRGLSTQTLHSLVYLNLNRRMVTYQRRMWCTPTYRVYKLC